MHLYHHSLLFRLIVCDSETSHFWKWQLPVSLLHVRTSTDSVRILLGPYLAPVRLLVPLSKGTPTTHASRPEKTQNNGKTSHVGVRNQVVTASKCLGFDSFCRSCVEVSSKLHISHCLRPPSCKYMFMSEITFGRTNLLVIDKKRKKSNWHRSKVDQSFQAAIYMRPLPRDINGQLIIMYMHALTRLSHNHAVQCMRLFLKRGVKALPNECI